MVEQPPIQPDNQATNSLFSEFLVRSRASLRETLVANLQQTQSELWSTASSLISTAAIELIDLCIAQADQLDNFAAQAVCLLQPLHHEYAHLRAPLAVLNACRRLMVAAGYQAIHHGIHAVDTAVDQILLALDHATALSANSFEQRMHIEMLQQTEELRATRDLLEQSFLNTPLSTIRWDNAGIIQFWNRSAERIFGWTAEEAVGQHIIKLVVPEVALEHVQQIVTMLLSGSMANSRNVNKTKDGRFITCEWHNAILRDNTGVVIGALSQTEDITERLRADEERDMLQQDIITAQSAALRELSTPLIPLADRVVAMPLIGSIDSNRAQQIMEELLNGVVTHHSRIAIVDITGVPVVDTQVANVLLRAAQAVNLLGARVVLTGIRPEVAQTLVGLGVDLSSIVTRSTLQAGIAYAFNQ